LIIVVIEPEIKMIHIAYILLDARHHSI